MLEMAIKKLLEGILTPLIGKGKVKPVFGTGKPPFVTYTITPIKGGAVKESQLEVKFIEADIDKALAIREAVSNLLDMMGASATISVKDVVLRSQLAGGGQLFNDAIQMWEISSIYIITWRCKKIER